MIQVREVSFAYPRGDKVLHSLTMDIHHEATAIIGGNGSGKTTFVKLLKGLLKPSSGDIRIDDQSIRKLTAAKLSDQVGLVFQNPNDQIFKDRVIDEVMFGPLNVGRNKELAYEKAKEALSWIGLEEKEGENPQDLSLSEKKQICIASVLAMETKIIIFDEPTIGQDFQGKKKIGQLIERLQEQGKLVLTISHDMDFVAEYFSRVMVFQQGRVICDGDIRDVFVKKSILQEAHVDRPYVMQLGDKIGYERPVLHVQELIDGYRK